MEVVTLTDGGQRAEDVAERIAGFIREAERSLELALYDVRLPDPVGSIVADELRAAAERGVTTRLIYNVDSGRPAAREVWQRHEQENHQRERQHQQVHHAIADGRGKHRHQKHRLRHDARQWTRGLFAFFGAGGGDVEQTQYAQHHE